ncbi:MAG: MBL fold metallo-hydrolase [Gemmatimonadota bacterium]
MAAVAGAERVGAVLLAALWLGACGPRAAADRSSSQGAGAPGPADSLTYASGTHLVLLGTGTPNADPDRWGPALAVVVDGRAYLVDAGPGVVRRAAAAARRGVRALEASHLEIAFLTHLHSDHTLGLPDLILSAWVLERGRPLRLFGPTGSRAMVDHLLQAYAEDIRVRIAGPEPIDTLGYRVEVREIEPGPVYEDDRVRVLAFRVPHGAWPEAYGYRFETADRSIVISGDTRPSDAIVEACSGCDLLVHEVYSEAGFARRRPEWQRYHADAHTSARKLGELASRARPGLLVLYHELLWGSTPEELLAEVRSVYDGPVAFGRDLEIY